MLSFGRIALLIGFGLLFFNLLMGQTAGKIEVATTILGGLILSVGLISRIAYVFSKEDEE